MDLARTKTTANATVADQPGGDLARTVLLVDAALSTAFAAIVIAGARPVARFLGWNKPFAFVLFGAVTLPYAAILSRSTRRAPIGRAAVLVPALLNTGLAVGSDIVLLTDRPALATGGRWAVAGFGVGAALLAAAQFIAGRRMR